MSENYDAELCEEKHKTLNDTVDEHEIWLKKHDEEISSIKQDNRENKTDIRNLIKKMDDFISAMQWGLGIFVTVSIFVIGVLLKR